jgi:hypothetical protein
MAGGNAFRKKISYRWQHELDAPARAAIIEETKLRLRERMTLTLTPEIAASIVQLIREGNYPVIAARSLGVNERTFKNWLSSGERDVERGEPSQTDPEGLMLELYLEVEMAEAVFETGMVKTIKERIDANKNWTGHMTYLERRFPDRWGKRYDAAPPVENWETQLRAYTLGVDSERARSTA